LRRQQSSHHLGDQTSFFTAAREFFGAPATPRLLDVLSVRFELWWLIRGQNRRLGRDFSLRVLDRIVLVEDEEGFVSFPRVRGLKVARQNLLRPRFYCRVVAHRRPTEVQFGDLYHRRVP
jgi:hypothetical protein